MILCGTPAKCESKILSLGGSEAAARFYRDTGVFLTGLYPAGAVDIGFVSAPGANYVPSPLLLTQPVTSVDDLATSTRIDDPLYRRLLDRYPAAFVTGGNGAVEPPRVLPSGDALVTFRFGILDGCMACEYLGTLRMTVAIDGSGRFDGVQSTQICGNYDVAAFELQAPGCPLAYLDATSPITTTARTPKEAARMFLDAWESFDMAEAARVASGQAVGFAEQGPPGPDVALSRCQPWGEEGHYTCGMGFDGVGFIFVVVAPATEGFFVSSVSYSE